MAPQKLSDNYAFTGRQFRKAFTASRDAERFSHITNDYHGRRLLRSESRASSLLAPPSLNMHSQARRQYNNVQWPNGVPTLGVHVRSVPANSANPKRVKTQHLLATVVSTSAASAILDSMERKYGRLVLVFLDAHWKRIHQNLKTRFARAASGGIINAAPEQIGSFINLYIEKYFRP